MILQFFPLRKLSNQLEIIMQKITIKRPVTIKTIVTSNFKRQATEELLKEIHLLESQIMQLEIQNKKLQDQVFSNTFMDEIPDNIQRTLKEIQEKLEQMHFIKQELYSQKETVENILLDNLVVTGSLENYVEVTIGENIYDKFKEAEIIVKDGIIQQIKV